MCASDWQTDRQIELYDNRFLKSLRQSSIDKEADDNNGDNNDDDGGGVEDRRALTWPDATLCTHGATTQLQLNSVSAD